MLQPLRSCWSHFLSLIAATALLAGCSALPPELRKAPESDPGLSVVRDNPSRYFGQRVRWGGVIANVNNLPTETRLTIVSRPLFGSGEPTCNERTSGRFIVAFPGFLDPAIYRPSRLITITGVVSGSQTMPIDQHDYLFPVLSGQAHHLWDDSEEYCERDTPPWVYDPWYPYRYQRPTWQRWP